MTDLKTAAQQALEALKMMRDEYGEYACPACDHADAAIYALKTALAEPVQEPVQEPVAYWNADESSLAFKPGRSDMWVPLYADPKPCPTCVSLARAVMMDQTGYDIAPPQRKPLTEEEP